MSVGKEILKIPSELTDPLLDFTTGGGEGNRGFTNSYRGT